MHIKKNLSGDQHSSEQHIHVRMTEYLKRPKTMIGVPYIWLRIYDARLSLHTFLFQTRCKSSICKSYASYIKLWKTQLTYSHCTCILTLLPFADGLCDQCSSLLQYRGLSRLKLLTIMFKLASGTGGQEEGRNHFVFRSGAT
ncbi:unnamed protein product [Somion occarium]|uniref:Uncharacterized protein n=1 Tax=Somion occarium TaxID=3059160 RepID=A0ABP1E672_9APHY